jgi:hypothetical protein
VRSKRPADGTRIEFEGADLQGLGFDAAVALGSIFHRSSRGSLRDACPNDVRLDRAARSSIMASSCN